MIDAAKIEELRGLLAADTSTDWQTIRADSAEGADVWWICAKNAAGQDIELGSLQGGFPHPKREARARLIVAMRNALPDLLDAAERASRAREDALREAIEICKEADAQDDRNNGAAATGAACNAANAILALINKPKGGDANEGRSGTTRETRHPATSPGVTAGASAGWQSIETAPRDGTRFLTWDSYYGVRMGRAFMRADHDDWLSYVDSNGSSHKGGIRASHWIPLPAAPVDGGEDA